MTKIEEISFLSEKGMLGIRPSPLYGVISITDFGRTATLPQNWRHILRLQFDDVEETEPLRPYGCSVSDVPFRKQDAKQIVWWLEKTYERRLAGIYIHCWGGVSRSAAVAKWIAERYSIPFDHEYDGYNRLVYNLLQETSPTIS